MVSYSGTLYFTTIKYIHTDVMLRDREVADKVTQASWEGTSPLDCSPRKAGQGSVQTQGDAAG